MGLVICQLPDFGEFLRDFGWSNLGCHGISPIFDGEKVE
jgi:hypothetical protein